jgi:dienelactone hydrolase
MRALVLLFASSLALASAQAGEMAKQGDESSTLYLVGLPGTGEMVGIKRTDNGDEMFDKMGVRITESGDHRETVLIDAEGDQVFITFESDGTFRYVRGTGQYAGISGAGTWTCDSIRPVGPESLRICENKSKWKLLAAAQTSPPMGGGYTDVIPIPVNDPATKAIAGALFKPEGAGPFPAVVYMVTCYGIRSFPEEVLEKTVIDHLRSKGVATLIVDPFRPRNEPGICENLNDPNLNEKKWAQYATRGGSDAVAAVQVLRSMPDIDANRIFLQGYSYGAGASLFAVDPKTAGAHDGKIAGVIAYYPYCLATEASVPTLILVGEKDDWTPAALCVAAKDKPNIEVVVLPGATHGFNMTYTGEYMGHRLVYDEKATQDAERRADAFMDAHMPPK